MRNSRVCCNHIPILYPLSDRFITQSTPPAFLHHVQELIRSQRTPARSIGPGQIHTQGISRLADHAVFESTSPLFHHSSMLLAANQPQLVAPVSLNEHNTPLNPAVRKCSFSESSAVVISNLSIPKSYRPAVKTHYYAAADQEQHPLSHAPEYTASARLCGNRRKKRYMIP